MVPHAAEIIKFAQSCLSIREDPPGSNDGKALRAVLAPTDWQPGEAYCLFGALACLYHAFGGREHLPYWIDQRGSCHLAAIKASNFGKLSIYPATGCIFLLKGGATGWRHAGIVTGIRNYGQQFASIEFNSNDDGSTEGIGVFAHERDCKTCDFLEW